LISVWSLPQTQLGEFTVLPGPLAVFKGSTSKRREGKRGGEEEREGKGVGKRRGSEKEREKEGRGGTSPQYFGLEPPLRATPSEEDFGWTPRLK